MRSIQISSQVIAASRAPRNVLRAFRGCTSARAVEESWPSAPRSVSTPFVAAVAPGASAAKTAVQPSRSSQSRAPQVALNRAPEHVAELPGRHERRHPATTGAGARASSTARRRTRARDKGCLRRAARSAVKPSSRGRSRAGRTGRCQASAPRRARPSAPREARVRRRERDGDDQRGRAEPEDGGRRARAPRSAPVHGSAACGRIAPRRTRVRRRYRRRTGRRRRRARRSPANEASRRSGSASDRGAMKRRNSSAGKASVGTLKAG